MVSSRVCSLPPTETFESLLRRATGPCVNRPAGFFAKLTSSLVYFFLPPDNYLAREGHLSLCGLFTTTVRLTRSCAKNVDRCTIYSSSGASLGFATISRSPCSPLQWSTLAEVIAVLFCGFMPFYELRCHFSAEDLKLLDMKSRRTDCTQRSYVLLSDTPCTSQDRRPMSLCTLYPFISTSAQPFINQ